MMLLTDQHPLNKSITVALLGNPNVGKSSLINELLGFDLSIVSDKPQTTRNQFHCAFTVDHTEIILIDTPGLHQSSKEMNLRMIEQAEESFWGSDIILLLMDSAQDLMEQQRFFERYLKDITQPVWLVLTKKDLGFLKDDLAQEFYQALKEKFNCLQNMFFVSSQDGENIHLLTGALVDVAKPGPHHYPSGEVSNKNERFFVAEYIREQTFRLFRDEVPYEIAVTLDEFKDITNNDKDRVRSQISASILVNRPSQRAIVVGAKGSNIKKIGTEARKKIEMMTGAPVNLNLHVKVSPKWFKNNFVLEELGLPRAKNSHRVWRSQQ